MNSHDKPVRRPRAVRGNTLGYLLTATRSSQIHKASAPATASRICSTYPGLLWFVCPAKQPPATKTGRAQERAMSNTRKLPMRKPTITAVLLSLFVELVSSECFFNARMKRTLLVHTHLGQNIFGGFTATVAPACTASDPCRILTL